MADHSPNASDIAIIGMAGRFPGAPDLEVFWQHIRDGVESISDLSDAELLAADISPEIFQKSNYVRRNGRLDDIEFFAAEFFGYTPREATLIDPQQRVFLECAWQAVEDAGYDPERISGLVGVYAGASMNSYVLQALQDPEIAASQGTLFLDLGNAPDFLALRVSYKLNLRGPGVVVQSACSTSLLAVHMACQSLLSGECDLALAGGVSIHVPQAGYAYREGGIGAPDGRCRAFDAQAQGTVPGNGAGVVLLKRLSEALADGDCVRAVIKGSAANNDGTRKAGFTAPSADGQAAVITEALAMAGVDPDSITLIEAHGTGTPLGDPIEVQALTQAFRASGSNGTGFCALGSLKTNIGHLDAAAGIAGLIKAVLALQHRQLPPSLHFQSPNPSCAFETSPFYVNTQLRSWTVPAAYSARRAGVSAFGIGGTNVHVVLEEAPSLPSRAQFSSSPSLLLLSAKTPTALEQMTHRFTGYLSACSTEELSDVSATLQLGRRHFAHRRFLLAGSITDCQHEAQARWVTGHHTWSNPSVVFLLPGQGSLVADAGQQLYQTEPVFRRTCDACAEILQPLLKQDLRMFLSDPLDQEQRMCMQETEFAQPMQFILSYALARLWQHWGVQPQALLGHSLGEYVAACLAGVFTLDDALRLIALRGSLMQQTQPGAMLSVELAVEDTRARLVPDLEIAAVNGEALTVVAGPRSSLTAWQQQLQAEGVTSRLLRVTRAFHSALLDPIVPEFVAALRKVQLQAPRIPYISNVTGTWITTDQVTDPIYWGRQLREPVQFLQGLYTLQEVFPAVLLEVGPGTSLSSLVRRQRRAGTAPQVPAVIASMPHPADMREERTVLLEAVGHLWLNGVSPDWAALARSDWRRVPLPTYPFERGFFWYSPAPRPGSAQSRSPEASLEQGEQREEALSPGAVHIAMESAEPASVQQHPIEEIIIACWRDLLGVMNITSTDDFFTLGGDSLVASLVMARLSETFESEMPLRLIFEYPTIAALARAVEDQLIAQLETLPESR